MIRTTIVQQEATLHEAMQEAMQEERDEPEEKRV
jgi:hypothetical protein